MQQQQILLTLAVLGVGVLHTLVPDHWAPIVLLARQNGWNRASVVRAAAMAGTGHAVSTLIIAAIVWLGGVVLAARFGHVITIVSSLALVAFGAWIAIGSLREIRSGHGHGHEHFGHAHVHRHDDGTEHRHWHEHHDEDWHATEANAATAMHEHEHKTSGRTSLLLILGSSPMIEGIPAFFAASRFGVAQLILMAVVFAGSTIATYIIVCAASASGIERLNLGPVERYGEVLSGGLIALLGIVFLFLPAP